MHTGAHAEGTRGSIKKEMFRAFLKDNRNVIEAVKVPRTVARRRAAMTFTTSAEVKSALAKQVGDTTDEQAKCEDAGQALIYGSVARLDEGRGQCRVLSASEIPPSPLDLAIKLIAESGVWRSEEQYLVTLFMLQPAQELWKKAQAIGALHSLRDRCQLAELTKGIRSRTLFLHGPGGSGKTYCMTEVVVKVIRTFFGEEGVKAIAASNSAARLLGGKTMHAAGKMSRGQSLKAKKLKPNSRAKKALDTEWSQQVLLLADEIGQASPPLLAGCSRRASYGRKDLMKLDMSRILQEPFGNTFIIGMMGDFMQLNPVASHTLLEAFLPSGTAVPGVPSKTTEEDQDGFSVFRQICQNVVLFHGAHRFQDTNLPQLLEIMRTEGGASVPEALRASIRTQV